MSGGWNYYSINTAGGLGDYPKFGIWPDGIYMSVNMFAYAAGGAFINPRVYAFNKAQMYAGAQAIQVISFDAPSSDFTLLPSNARLQAGTPPAGTPNYFVSTWNFFNALAVYEFHVNWTSISLTTFTGPFTSFAGSSWPNASASFAPSLGGNSSGLDVLATRAMVQNQYSNIGGTESLWTSHTVRRGDTSGFAAPRWYQTNVTGGTVAANLVQGTTWDPDGANVMYRFLPSIAVDRLGDMALGYSTSSSSTEPAIKYAGRLAGDAVNTFSQTEQLLIQGAGTQLGNCGSGQCTRWGDYSAMTLDPDGCTFWYTNEYYSAVGLNDLTRIGSFSFPGCTTVSSGTLQGTVTNASSVALSGATVRLGVRTTTTDGAGHYSFTGLPAGTYPSITASFFGFTPVTFAGIAVTSAGSTTRNFSLNVAAQGGCFIDTTQADFQAGIPTNCDLTSSPGNVTLVNAAAIDQQNASVTNNGFGFTSTSWAGQTFTPSVTGQLTRADLDLFCFTCTGTTPNLTVSIRATTGGTPVPTGADLATATITGFSSGSAVYYSANFGSPATLTAGTPYAVIIRAVSSISAGTYAYVCSCTTDSNPYANGQRVTSGDSGSTWAADTTAGGRDLGFKIYMQSGYASQGTFLSSIKDANPAVGNVAAWSTLSWTASVPANTTLRFQAAASNSSTGPFSFVGPDGTASTFFSSGASLAQFNGNRYLQYEALLTTTNSSATPTINDVTVCYSNDALASTPSSLYFGATKAGAGGALTAVTAAQTVTVSFAGAAGAWTASANQSWLQVTGGSGSGSGTFTVGITNPSNVIGGSTSLSGSITLTAPAAGNSPLSVPVTLTVDQTGHSTLPAFGQVDTPTQNITGVQGALAVTGWAIDDVGVASVKIYRTCFNFDIQANCVNVNGDIVVYVGDASIIAGARPDVEAAYPSYPASNRAGWGFLILTNLLPHVPNQLPAGGQGTFTFYVYATDIEGHITRLGRSTSDSTPTTATMANDSIAKPFGAIDTPTQGGTVSGASFANFGWVITPDPGSGVLMPTDGSTIIVYVDGAPIGPVSYNNCRGTVGNPVPGGIYCNDDIASIFGNATPQATFTTRTSNPSHFRNLDVARGAIGALVFDTTAMTNGVHTIAWGATDSASRPEGIGSRYFTVLNAGGGTVLDRAALEAAPGQSRGSASSLADVAPAAAQVVGRTGFDPTTPFDVITPTAEGHFTAQLPELGRIELWLGSSIDAGYHVANADLRDLPPGSHLDAATGQFTWAPGPGYLGTYHFAFLHGGQQVPVDITIRPMTSVADGTSQIRMNVDLPTDGSSVHGPVTMAGWALDPQAWTGAGIGAVHVWAFRVDAPSMGPQFLGTAALGLARPDVATAFGAQFGQAGFSLTTTALSPGEYDVVAYAWCDRTQRFEDARTVRVIVR